MIVSAKSLRSALLASAIALSTLSAAAQVTYAPDGGTRETIQSLTITAKPGAPFQATVTTTWKRRLEDGSQVTVYNHRTVARDSTGRIFQERRFFSPSGNTDVTRLSELDYYDPARKELTVCEPVRRLCTVRAASLPVDDPLPLPASMTTPAGLKITRESIGQKTMESLQVQGAHEISVSPRLGDAEPTVKELWYSPLLGLNVQVKRFEPRGGAQDFDMQSINRSEPDPRLFQPPQEYGIVRMVRER
ncbi:hypothetical protein [Terriglobus roseus]|uniref:DUF3108 domain-containing protein n=1 Tax=Terriglobus roseus TaxID=392734 RepID=A0A1H4MG17_9BACT|nr:hypothetical protein [Terriglobus roseus]SEB82016.1 hypothetical protein SAMN05443244_1925 [Terriglobus roseus]